MKNRQKIGELLTKIRRLETEMGGVFTFSDLSHVLELSTSSRAASGIGRLLREGLLIKVRRNLYCTANPNLWLLASQMKKQAYVSMDCVLAQNGLIGTRPERLVRLVYPGPPQTIETPFGRIQFFMASKARLFGFEPTTFGIRVADNEKAFIDMLYYRMKGARFVIDPRSDVRTDLLNRAKIKKYLRAYHNARFKKFVEGILS